MKILYLYQDVPFFRYDKWLRTEFIRQLPELAGIDVAMYGPGCHDVCPELTPVLFDPSLSYSRILNITEPDFIIVAQKSRMHINYSHKKSTNTTWLPSDFSHTNHIPKIVIEEDYHYEDNDRWYKDNNISVILQRHFSQSLREESVPMEWFPFSVDTNVFHPDPAIERINKICFVGHMQKQVYPSRHEAVQRLSAEGMIHSFPDRAKVGEDYTDTLQRYVCHLSCGSIYHTTPAKTLEIIASGSLLLTNRFQGLSHYIGDECCVIYEDDASNVVNLSRVILGNANFVKRKVKIGLSIVKKRHTHGVRADELRRILEELQ